MPEAQLISEGLGTLGDESNIRAVPLFRVAGSRVVISAPEAPPWSYTIEIYPHTGTARYRFPCAVSPPSGIGEAWLVFEGLGTLGDESNVRAVRRFNCVKRYSPLTGKSRPESGLDFLECTNLALTV